MYVKEMYYGLRVEREEDGSCIAFFLDDEEMVGFICAPEEFSAMARDLLIYNVEQFFKAGKVFPMARHSSTYGVAMPLMVQCKVAIHNELLRQNLSREELARRLAISSRELRRLLNPRRRSALKNLEKALLCLGVAPSLTVL